MRGRRHQIQAKRIEIEGVYFVMSEHSEVFGIDDSSHPLGQSSTQAVHSSALSSSLPLPLSSSSSSSLSSSSLPNEAFSTSPPPLKKDRMTLYFGDASSSSLTPHPTPTKIDLQARLSTLPEIVSSSSSSSSSSSVSSSTGNEQSASVSESNGAVHPSSGKVSQEQRVRNEVNEIVTARLQTFFDQGKIADMESFQHLLRHLVNIVVNKRIAAKKYEISGDGRKRIEEFVEKTMRPNNNDSFVYDYRLYVKKQQN